MKFSRIDAHHAVSDCGRYSIARVVVSGAPRYEAWTRGEARRMLGRWRIGDDARAAYESARLACAAEAGE